MISAHMVPAKGELIEVNQQPQPGLLCAIRGAEQFFDLVTQLVVKAYPLSDLGIDRGVMWAGSFVFPFDRAKAVTTDIKPLKSILLYFQLEHGKRNIYAIAASRNGEVNQSERRHKRFCWRRVGTFSSRGRMGTRLCSGTSIQKIRAASRILPTVTGRTLAKAPEYFLPLGRLRALLALSANTWVFCMVGVGMVDAFLPGIPCFNCRPFTRSGEGEICPKDRARRLKSHVRLHHTSRIAQPAVTTNRRSRGQLSSSCWYK